MLGENEVVKNQFETFAVGKYHRQVYCTITVTVFTCIYIAYNSATNVNSVLNVWFRPKEKALSAYVAKFSNNSY